MTPTTPRSRHVLLLILFLPFAGIADEGQARAKSASHPSGSEELTSEDFSTIRERYRRWVVGAEGIDSTNSVVRERSRSIIRGGKSALKSVQAFDFSIEASRIYDSREKGDDANEIQRIVASWLPSLAIAHEFAGTETTPNPLHEDAALKEAAMRLFDRLHERGFRRPMLMPWKSAHAKDPEPGLGIVVDMHLRVSGYALAVFLFRDELEESGRLERCLETCREILSHDEKYGDPGAENLNADGYRIAVNLALPYALAAGDRERLALIHRQTERSMAVDWDASDTIKPDGLGYHHRAAYLSGYSSYAVSQASFAAWLFRDTKFEISPDTLANLVHFHETLRFVCQKYDMHKALAGRLSSIRVIDDVLPGYAYLSDLDHAEREECLAMFARLADDEFLSSRDSRKSFHASRNEIPPGPAMIDWFHRVLKIAGESGAEADPSGNLALNFGPLMVHRRENWMASVKGYHKYLWAFERSLTDARMDDRRENVLGFHDSAASLYLYTQGDPVNARASGYFADGWDWCRIPGTTTHYLSGAELLTRDTRGRSYNRPFADSTFAGGVSDGRNGLFSMEYQEERPDERPQPLRALKSVFFHDDVIVCLSSGIRNGDGEHPVRTTLYQCALTPKEPTWVNGKRFTSDTGEVAWKKQPGGTRLLDPVGNGYWLPNSVSVTTSRGTQSSYDWKGIKKSEGDYASAWIDHGTDPQNGTGEYAILVGTTPEKLDAFAEAQSTGGFYNVLQNQKYAHIVEFPGDNSVAYALARALPKIKHGPLLRTSVPLLAMANPENGGKHLALSLCHPDLKWEKGKHYNFRKTDRTGNEPPTPPVESQFEVALRGTWKLNESQPGVVVLHENPRETVVEVTAPPQGVNLKLVQAD